MDGALDTKDIELDIFVIFNEQCFSELHRSFQALLPTRLTSIWKRGAFYRITLARAG